MGRSRSPESLKAEKMYKSGKKIVDIARQLDVPDSTVRRWKATQGWDDPVKKKPSVRSDKINERSKRSEKKSEHKKESFRMYNPPKGRGGSPGKATALKHNGYSEAWLNLLDDDERDLLENMQLDEEALLERQIQLYEVREYRLMKAINKYMDAPGGIYLERQSKTEVKRTFKDDEEKEEYEQRVKEKVEKGDRLPGEPYNLQSETEATINLIARLERELTTVQNKKNQAITDLANLRLEKKRMEGDEAQAEIAKDWVEKIKAMRGVDDGG